MAAHAKPNFFIAGAPKAGTTSLYHYLRQHPEIYMSPVKEPAYFAAEVRAERFAPAWQAKQRAQTELVRAQLGQGLKNNEIEGIVEEWEDYLRLFEGVTTESAVGEGSVCYLWSQSAPKAIAEQVPQAKIILILRHPAERAFSHYLHHLSDGNAEHGFTEYIQRALQDRSGILSHYTFLEYGMYAEQMERYFAHFPREQIRVWLYEETLTQPAEFLREVFQFLQVDDSFIPDTARRYYEMQIPRGGGVMQRMRRTAAWKRLKSWCPAAWKPVLKRAVYQPKGALRLSPEDRRFLVDYYRTDIEKLQEMLGRDLSAWLA